MSTRRQGDRSLLLTSRSSYSCSRESLAVPGHPVWVSRGRHRRRSSSAPLSSSPTSYPRCRFWTLLVCWGGIRWWRCCGSSTCRLSSRSSQCPWSLWTGSPSVLPFAIRRRQNSWWKCRRSPDIHWRSLPCKPWDGGQQWYWRSRSLTFSSQFGEEVAEVFKVSAQARVHSFLMVFSHISPAQKKCGGYPPVESESATSIGPSELSAHQMAPAGESDELEDDPSDSLDAALADGGVCGGRGGAEAEAAVQSSSPSTT